MHMALWLAQVLLAALFASHGWIYMDPTEKSLRRMDARSASRSLPVAFRRFIGIAEVLGAIGLVLPGILDFMPWLTAVAAACLVIVMAGASVFHARRGEFASVLFAVATMALAGIVAYGRYEVLPLN